MGTFCKCRVQVNSGGAEGRARPSGKREGSQPSVDGEQRNLGSLDISVACSSGNIQTKLRKQGRGLVNLRASTLCKLWMG